MESCNPCAQLSLHEIEADASLLLVATSKRQAMEKL